MFTEPPRLVERIARKIDDTAKVDPFSLVRPELASTANLAELLAHPSLLAELKSVGLPDDVFASESSPLARIEQSLPYLAQVRNTATAWRFFRILNDLYDFTDGSLDASNYQQVNDTIAARSAEPNWASEILAERCNIATIATNFQNHSEHADARLGVKTRYYLDLSPLITRHHISKSHVKQPYLSSLTQLLGNTPASYAQINDLVSSWLGSLMHGPTRFSSLRLPIRFSFKSPDEGAVNHLLERATGDVALNDEETDVIIHAVIWSILGWHHENRRSVQIIATGHSPFHPTTCPAGIAKFFGNFSGSRFIVLAGTGSLAETFTDLSARVPNVAIAGFGSGGFVNEKIARELTIRLQAAPIVKQAGFLSHASSVEWTYGNLQIIRRGIANALASMIQDDLIHENDVQGIVKQILGDTPRALYGLE